MQTDRTTHELAAMRFADYVNGIADRLSTDIQPHVRDDILRVTAQGYQDRATKVAE